MAEAILIVEDDDSTVTAVKLALEPEVIVHTAPTLYAALKFIEGRAHDIFGVIVDLNLTPGHDNFGRTVLERLREIGMPCVVFSGSIKSREDADRYANEFGVLGAIGKEPPAPPPLQELRQYVARMRAASVEQLRTRVRAELERELSRRESSIEEDRRRSDQRIEETARVAGRTASANLAATESARIAELRANGDGIRGEIMAAIDRAATREELESLRTDLPHALGVL